jgi:hypothetical protein
VRVPSASAIQRHRIITSPPIYNSSTAGEDFSSSSNLLTTSYQGQEFSTAAEEAVEVWMNDKPISLRRFEQHERVRLKICGKSRFLFAS